MDDYNYNDVKINSNGILSMSECIICSEMFDRCIITKCGHSFCEKCILNCMNLNNQCPTCKNVLKKEELVKNYLIDNITGYVKVERAKEEYNMIENIYANSLDSKLRMNPIQIIFMENMKKIFNSYNSFFEKIENDNKKKIKDLNNLLQDEACDIESKNLLNKRLEESRLNHSRLVKDIENSLDNVLKNLPESPLSLPIKTKIFIERKNFTIDNLLFNPTDSVEKLYEIVKTFFLNKGDEIQDIGDAGFYYLEKEYGADINSKFFELEKATRINPDSKFLSYGLNQGDVIVFKGEYVLRSEVPKHCITYQFENVINTVVKYFSCDTCSLNWLCDACTEHCHKNHNVKLHRENHVATWACCYCYRNKCMLKNNKIK